MQLLTIEDPRDNLQKATRFELVDFARKNGIQLDEGTPKIVSEKILRDRGFVNIQIPDRPLGLYVGGETHATNEPIVHGSLQNADDLLVAEYEHQKKEDANVSKMSMSRLRAECKSKGIKMDRRDNMQTLRAKLGQQNPA